MKSKYVSCRIADLLPRINRDILIPSIQRPYVWEPQQVVQLFDSLMRGYPINTFMLWRLEPAHLGDWDIYRFVRHFQQGNIHNDPAMVDATSAVTLVLDGQQRLTSLLIGLTGSYTVRNGLRGRSAGWVTKVLMLDLAQSAEGHDQDDEGSAAQDAYYGFKFVPAERLPRNEARHVWFKVADIWAISDPRQLAATVDHLIAQSPGLPAALHRLVAENLERLWTVVHREECIAYYLEQEQSYDKVLDIFIRANDGGTKLSKSDLLMSIVALRWESVNPREETEKVTRAMRQALDQDNAFDRDYLMRAGLFFNNLDFAFQLRNFTPRNIAIIEASWPRVSKALLMAAGLFKRFGIVGSALTGVNAVMLTACYLFKLNAGRPLEDWEVLEDDTDRIRRWIGAVLFHGVLSGAANVTMEVYRRELDEHLREARRFPSQALAQRMTVRGRDMTFNAEATQRFCQMDSKHRLFKVALSLLYPLPPGTAADWRLVRVIPGERLLEERLRLQGVPVDRVADYQAWSGTLANYFLLSRSEAEAYQALGFDDWVATRPASFWSRHLLPNDPVLYEAFNFLDFVEARQARIGQHLARVLSDAFTWPAPAEALGSKTDVARVG